MGVEDEHGKWLPQGAVSLVAGREGVGKSTVVANVVARITKDTLPGERFGHPKTVITCATEDSWRQTINPRLVAAGADLDKVIRVDAYTPEGFDGTLQLPEDIERVREIVESYDVVLIVLDPLMSTLSTKLDTHKDAEVRRGLEPYRGWPTQPTWRWSDSFTRTSPLLRVCSVGSWARVRSPQWCGQCSTRHVARRTQRKSSGSRANHSSCSVKPSPTSVA